MKSRIIIGNLLVTCVIFPILYIHNYWGNVLKDIYVVDNTSFPDLASYMARIYNGVFFFSVVLLLGSLFPFQYLKIKCLYKRAAQHYFIKSIALFISINILLVILTGYGLLLIMDFKLVGNQMPFVLVLVVFSILIQTILYFVIDQYMLLEIANNDR